MILAEISSIQLGVKAAVVRGGMDPEAANAVFAALQRYDDLVTSLALRNALLECGGTFGGPKAGAGAGGSGRGSGVGPGEGTMPPPTNAVHGAAPAYAPTAAPRARKPVETWSAVVMCDDPSISGKQIAERVRKEVAPALGVRVHEVRELKRGGAVIRTPSVSEMKKVVANKKFAEVGLKVQPNKSQRPKVQVFDVDTGILPEEFMEELYTNNFKEEFSPVAFKKAVHLETKPWSVTDGERVNLTLEVDEKALNLLEQTGRVYIKWFSYRCRSLVHTYACHRCLGFDHKVSQCRVKETICRQCGQAGHTAPRCTNPVDCRNCRFKGFPSRHSMLSETCPIYGAVLARVNARH
jgi:hypothetical protein